MKKVFVEADAAAELSSSIEFYEEARLGLGIEFKTSVWKAIQVIQRQPDHYPLKSDGTRSLLMARFPFNIRYVELPETIWIVAIAHTSRRPNYWKDRLRNT